MWLPLQSISVIHCCMTEHPKSSAATVAHQSTGINPATMKYPPIPPDSYPLPSFSHSYHQCFVILTSLKLFLPCSPPRVNTSLFGNDGSGYGWHASSSRLRRFQWAHSHSCSRFTWTSPLYDYRLAAFR